MFIRAVIALPLALVCVSATAEYGDIVWTTGVEYSSGDYGGNESIEDIYVPVMGRIDLERVSLQLTIPYLSVSAPSGTTTTGPGGEPLVGTGVVARESGLGDIIAGATVYDVFYSADLGLALDLTGKIKFGTADDEKGLGTGEQDYTVRADLIKFHDRLTLLASLGYKIRGEPEGYELKDVMLGSVGGVIEVNDRARFGFYYDYRESALVDGDALSELSGFVSRRIGERLQIQLYAFSGFSDGSPEWGAGLLFQIT